MPCAASDASTSSQTQEQSSESCSLLMALSYCCSGLLSLSPSLACGSAPIMLPCRNMTAEKSGFDAAYAFTAPSVNSAACPLALAGWQQAVSSASGVAELLLPYTA